MFEFLGDLFGLNKGKATSKAALENKGLLGDLKTEGMDIIDAGTAGARGHLDSAIDLTSLGAGGKGIYADALGLGGEEGTARALGAFQQGPGYQFALDQGLDALERRGSAQGRLQSGQTGIDTMTYATGLAYQRWQQWLDNLNLGINRNVSSLGDLATLEGNDASSRLNLSTGITEGLMGGNNQNAAGIEKNKEGIAAFGKGLFDLGGKAFGYGVGF
jgi:hypothetical protein